MEALDEARGARPELRWERRHDLELGGRHDRPEAELRGRPGQAGQEQRLGLVGGHAGEPRPVAVDEADPAERPRSAKIGTPAALSSSTSRWMVRTDTSSSRASSAAVSPPRDLEQEQEVDEAAGAHRAQRSADC